MSYKTTSKAFAATPRNLAAASLLNNSFLHSDNLLKALTFEGDDSPGAVDEEMANKYGLRLEQYVSGIFIPNGDIIRGKYKKDTRSYRIELLQSAHDDLHNWRRVLMQRIESAEFANDRKHDLFVLDTIDLRIGHEVSFFNLALARYIVRGVILALRWYETEAAQELKQQVPEFVPALLHVLTGMIPTQQQVKRYASELKSVQDDSPLHNPTKTAQLMFDTAADQLIIHAHIMMNK